MLTLWVTYRLVAKVQDQEQTKYRRKNNEKEFYLKFKTSGVSFQRSLYHSVRLNTFYSIVALEGIDNSIDIVNDLTSCKNEVDEISNLLNETKDSVILMHMGGGGSKRMNYLTDYNQEDPDIFHK